MIFLTSPTVGLIMKIQGSHPRPKCHCPPPRKKGHEKKGPKNYGWEFHHLKMYLLLEMLGFPARYVSLPEGKEQARPC